MYYSGESSRAYLHPDIENVDELVRLKVGFRTESKRWAPRIIIGHTPDSAMWVDDVVLLTEVINHGHFGHWLLDNMLSGYQLLELFNLGNAPKIMILDVNRDPGCNVVHLSNKRCRQFEVDTYGSVNGVRYTTVPELKLQAGSRPVCFRTLLAGIGKYGADAGMEDGTMTAPASGSYRRFRDWLLSRLDPKLYQPVEQQKVLTVLRKQTTGNHALLNPDEILQDLKVHFEPRGWVVVGMNADSMPSLAEQATQMQRTSVLFTPAGGIGHLNMLMKDFSAVVVPAACYPCNDPLDIRGNVDIHGAYSCCIQMDAFFADYFPNFHLRYYYHNNPHTLHGNANTHWGNWNIEVDTSHLIAIIEEAIDVLNIVNERSW